MFYNLSKVKELQKDADIVARIKDLRALQYSNANITQNNGYEDLGTRMQKYILAGAKLQLYNGASKYDTAIERIYHSEAPIRKFRYTQEEIEDENRAYNEAKAKNVQLLKRYTQKLRSQLNNQTRDKQRAELKREIEQELNQNKS